MLIPLEKEDTLIPRDARKTHTSQFGFLEVVDALNQHLTQSLGVCHG